MIVQIALATMTHPDQWWATDDTTLATVLDELDDESTKD